MQLFLERELRLEALVVFTKKHRKARLGINPKTSERTQVSEKFVPFFKPGKLLKEMVNKV